MPDDRQSQSDTLRFATQLRAPTIEPFEDPFVILRGNPRTGIAHRKEYRTLRIRAPLQPHLHRRTGRRMLQCIVDEVQQGLLHGGRVGRHLESLTLGRHLHTQVCVPIRGHGRQNPDGLAHQPWEMDRLGHVLLPPLFDPGEIEDVLNQRSQPPRLLHEESRVLASLRRIFRAPFGQRLRQQAQGREGRPQFVRDRRHEIRLLLVQRELAEKCPTRLPQPDPGHAHDPRQQSREQALLPDLRAEQRLRLPEYRAELAHQGQSGLTSRTTGCQTLLHLGVDRHGPDV